MVTPDAYATDSESLGKLVRPIAEGHAVAAYGRQLPHKGAGFFEAFPREFNYPAQSHMRCLADKVKQGRQVFFCSNSFAAYSSKALDEIGGFPEVLLGEDTVAVAQLLRHGYRVAYVAEATVYHSHRYSLLQEFRRYFDTGLARAEYGNLLQCASTDHQRGRTFAKAMLERVTKHKPYLLPYALLHLGAKWAGYSLGQAGQSFPNPIKRILSAHPHYWKG